MSRPGGGKSALGGSKSGSWAPRGDAAAAASGDARRGSVGSSSALRGNSSAVYTRGDVAAAAAPAGNDARRGSVGSMSAPHAFTPRSVPANGVSSSSALRGSSSAVYTRGDVAAAPARNDARVDSVGSMSAPHTFTPRAGPGNGVSSSALGGFRSSSGAWPRASDAASPGGRTPRVLSHTHSVPIITPQASPQPPRRRTGSLSSASPQAGGEVSSPHGFTGSPGASGSFSFSGSPAASGDHGHSGSQQSSPLAGPKRAPSLERYVPNQNPG